MNEVKPPKPPETPGPPMSAVIPTYNRGTLAVRAVESALRQTIPPAEIIVVDDGSNDNTSELMAHFGSRITYIQQENSGSAAARNRGFQAANTGWVALLDSDDVWVPDHLERISQAVTATGGAANYYFADTLQPPERGGSPLWQSLKFAIHGAYEFREDGSDWALMGIQPMMLQSTVFKRAAFLAVGGFLKELRYRDDTHMFLRLGLEQPLCAVSGVGAEMSADDDPNNRLTFSYNRSREGYRMQVIMNNDLLASMPQIQPSTRDLLRSRLANAHWSLARMAWQTRDIGEFLGQIGRSATSDTPRHFAGRFMRLSGAKRE